MDEATPPPDPLPPLVERVADTPPVRAVRPPRPGLVEGFFWCVLFWVVLVLGFAGVGLVALAAATLRADRPADFLEATLKAVRNSGAPDAARPPAADDIGRVFAWAMLAAQTLCLGFVLLVLRRVVGRDWPRQLAWRRPTALQLLATVAVVPGFMVFGDAVERLVTWAGARPLLGGNQGDALRDIFAPWPWWLTVLTVGVAPGLLEEVWCRGFLGRGFVARYGFVRGVAFTSVFFGFLHLDPMYALVTAPLGAVLHLLYFATRTLWVPMVVHALNNALAVLGLLGRVPTLDLSAAPGGLVAAVYLAGLCLLGFTLVALWTGRPRPESAGGWVPEYPAISLPPAGGGAEWRAGRTSPAAAAMAAVSLAALAYLLSR